METMELPGGKLNQIDAVEFITGGHAKFTIRNSVTGNRFTYRVMCPKDKSKDLSPILFVAVMTGSDNEHSFTYIGNLRFGNGAWKFDYGRKSKISPEALSVQVFGVIFNTIWSLYRTKPNLELWHEGHCCRCGHPLTVPESIARGIGSECMKIKSSTHR